MLGNLNLKHSSSNSNSSETYVGDINGIIEEYTAASGSNISAGDFVKWVNRYAESDRVSAELCAFPNASFRPLTAFEISDNRVFIMHNDNPGNMANVTPYVIICRVSETGIEVGKSTQISSSYRSGYARDAAYLSGNKVFISHMLNSYEVVGLICTVNDLSISIGTPVSLYKYSSSYNSNRTIISLLSNNRVAVGSSCGSGSTYYSTIHICDIDEDDLITVSSSISVGGVAYIQQVVKMSENKLVAFYTSSSTGSTLNGMIFNINGFSVSKSSAYTITSNINNPDTLTALKVSDNNILLLYIYSSKVYGIVCTITDEIVIGTPLVLKETATSVAAFKNSIDTVFVMSFYPKYVSSSNYQGSLSKTICTVDGTDIIVDEDSYIIPTTKVYNTSDHIACFYINNKVFTIHPCTSNGYLQCMLLGSFNNGVHQLELVDDKLFGIAKNNGTNGDMIQVVRPSIKSEEI